MKAVTALFLYQQIEQIKLRLDALEANSRVAASSDQPVVGPPVSLPKDSPALARPLTLAEVKTMIEEDKELPEPMGWSVDYRDGWRDCCVHFLQRLTELDHGPVASSPDGNKMLGASNIDLAS